MNTIKGKHFFCSWSGGKDSCLALYHALQNGGLPKHLLTMFTNQGNRSRAHGLPLSVLETQARSLSIPLVIRKTSWEDYESTFLSVIREFKKDGVDYGVFGDIDLDAHLEWVERVCSLVDIRPYEPLWKRERRDLLNEFLQLGFKATIIVIKQGALSPSFLGRTLDQQVITDMEKTGIDASGEQGEYHTVVTDGPIFSSAIHLQLKDQVVRNGYCFLDVSIGTEIKKEVFNE